MDHGNPLKNKDHKNAIFVFPSDKMEKEKRQVRKINQMEVKVSYIKIRKENCYKKS